MRRPGPGVAVGRSRDGFWRATAWDGRGLVTEVRLAPDRETARHEAMAELEQLAKRRGAA